MENYLNSLVNSLSITLINTYYLHKGVINLVNIKKIQKMGLNKGQTNNRDGRPKGSQNIKTKEWKQLGEAITSKHADRFNNILNSLNDEDFVKAYILIIGYFKPKMQATQIDAQIGYPIIKGITFERRL